MYVPAELPLSSYAAPPKMNDYLPKNASAYSAPPSTGYSATSAPTPYHPPGTQPMVGTPYHGPSAKPRAPLSPQIVDNHSPQPYHQQPAWQKPQQSQQSYQSQQQQQSSYQQDSQQQKSYQQSSSMSTSQTTSQKSMYDQANNNSSSGITTVKDMRNRFSGQNISGQSQTLPRNFLSAPAQQQQQQPAYNGGSPLSPVDANSKVRNASPLPFGRHATTTNKTHFENSYTKTQFHNKLYQPPKGPLQHSFINNQRSSSHHQVRGAQNGGRGAVQNNYHYQQQQQQSAPRPASHYDTYPQKQQHQDQYNHQEYNGQTQNHNQADQHQQYEHVSRSHFRTPAQQNNAGPVFRNVTNFCLFCR